MIKKFAFLSLLITLMICSGSLLFAQEPSVIFTDGFETGIDNWVFFYAAPSGGEQPVIQQSIVHSGTNALSIRNNSGTGWYLRPREMVEAQPGQVYRVTLWVKSGAAADLSMQFASYDGQNELIEQEAKILKLPSTNTWHLVTLHYAVPKNVFYISPHLVNFGKDTVYIDDLELSLVDTLPPNEWLDKDYLGIPGTVTGSNGKPVRTFMHILDENQKYLGDVSTNDAGLFVIDKTMFGEPLSDGGYYLQVYPDPTSKDGFVHRFNFQVRNGYPVGGKLDVKLQRAQISGKVIDPETGGYADSRYSVTLCSKPLSDAGTVAYLHVFDNGRYAYSGLADGEYELFCSPSDEISERYLESRPVTITIKNGLYTGPELDLAPVLNPEYKKDMLPLVSIPRQGTAMTFYVSPKGNDVLGKGTLLSPWKTIAHASKHLKAGDSCILRGGIYAETLRPTSSGTKEKPITYSAYANESVIITGTEPLGGWQRFRDNIYFVELKQDADDSTHLLRNGSTMWEARWPNLTAYTMDGFKKSMAVVDSGTPTSLTDAALSQSPGDWTDAEIWIRTSEYSDGFGGFFPQRATIESFDEQTNTLSFHLPLFGDAFMNPSKNNDYYLFGNLNMLDQSREWYIDDETSRVYVLGTEGMPPLGISIKRRENTIDLSNAHYIQIDGIQSLVGNINLDGASHCSLENMTISWLNYTAISSKPAGPLVHEGIVLSGNNNVIRNSSIGYTSENGIRISGNDNRIINNLLHNINFSAAELAAPILLEGDRNLISHNTIQNAGRMAIKLGGRENDIQYNDIDRFMILSADSAAIYAFEVDGQRTRIHHNHIHGSVGIAPGLYLDNNARNFTIDHNLFTDIEANPLSLNTPQNFNLIYNNSFYKTGYNMKFGNGYGGSQAYFHEWFRNELVNNIFNINVNRSPLSDEYLFEKNAEIDVFPEILPSSQKSIPGYRSPTTGDFSLSEQSGLIDAGKIIPGITDNYLGTAPDVGAFESGREPWTPGRIPAAKLSPVFELPAIVGQNLLNNSCFEYYSPVLTNGKYSTTLDDWKKTGNGNVSVQKMNGGLLDWHNRGGKVRLHLQGGMNGVEQTVTGLLPNTEYELSGWTYADSGETICFGVSAYGGVALSSSHAGGDPYRRDIVTFKTGPSNTSVLVFIKKTSTGSNSAYADDFGLRRITE